MTCVSALMEGDVLCSLSSDSWRKPGMRSEISGLLFFFQVLCALIAFPLIFPRARQRQVRVPVNRGTPRTK
jgi:hypothetical protein